MLHILKVVPADEAFDELFKDCSDGTVLLQANPKMQLAIKAPIYWWVDTDWTKYFFNMPLDNIEFCLDAHDESGPSALDLKFLWNSAKLEPRQLMQILPLSTYVTAAIVLSYQEIVDVCTNYINGEYVYTSPYSFPNTKEWNDFCETLLDIKGVRDLVEEK